MQALEGQPNTQLLLLENYMLCLSIWAVGLPSSPLGCPEWLAQMLDQGEGEWATWTGLQHRPDEKKVQSQESSKTSGTCQRGLELVKIPTEVYKHKFYRFAKQEIDICLISEV